MQKYLNNINYLINLPKKNHYDKTTKFAVAKINNKEIFLTEFLFAKQRGWIKDLRGHSEIDINYYKLLPWIFNYIQEIHYDSKSTRLAYIIDDNNKKKIYHIVDKDNYLLSIYVVREKEHYRFLKKAKKVLKNPDGEAPASPILSPAWAAFWHHPDFIEQLYQKFTYLSNKTILLTRHDKIGDFITALPMAKVLKQYCKCKIIFLVSKINEPLAKKMPFIDEVIVFEKNIFNLAKKIKSKHIDISISAYIDIRLGISLLISGIKIKVAPKTKIAQIFFNKTIRQKRSEVKMTEWQYNLELLRLFDKDIVLKFIPPLYDFGLDRKNFVIFHPGFGGSSEGNLKLKDYIYLAKSIEQKTNIVFTFGPDDKKSLMNFKALRQKYNLNATIKDDFSDIYEFAKFISQSKIFVSTSTGPMHLAALSNTVTISFFGNNLFASFKRWASINDTSKQHNFLIPKDYDKALVGTIKNTLLELV